MKHAVYLEVSKAEWDDLVEKVGLKCGTNKCHKNEAYKAPRIWRLCND